jgi:hypothetical protein
VIILSSQVAEVRDRVTGNAKADTETTETIGRIGTNRGDAA